MNNQDRSQKTSYLKISGSSISRIFQLIGSIIFLVLLFRKINFVDIWVSISLLKPHYLLLSILILFLARYILAVQMSLGLSPLGLKSKVIDLFRIGLISTFYSLILPGELVAYGISWYKLSRFENNKIETATLLIYFRLINTLTLVGIGVIGMWFDTNLLTTHLRFLIGGLFISLLLVIFVLFSPALTNLLTIVSPILVFLQVTQKVQGLLLSFRTLLFSFQLIRSRTVILILGLSILSNFLGVIIYYSLSIAADLNISIFVISMLFSLIVILQMLPISFAGLGLREVSLVVLLQEYNIPSAQALSFSLGIFTLTLILGLVGGIIEFWKLFMDRDSIHA